MIASNQAFIITAYAVTWAVLLAYLFRLVRKSARARREYDRVAPASTGGHQP